MENHFSISHRTPQFNHHHHFKRWNLFLRHEFLEGSACAVTKLCSFTFFTQVSSHCVRKKSLISLSHFLVDLRGEVDFNTLRWPSWSLGHNRDNQNYSIFPITAPFPQEASSFRKLCWSEFQLGCAVAWIMPQSLLQFQGCESIE